MIIRKKYDFESSHIVRNCTSERCKYSVHGHSFEIEIFLTADKLDNGQMIYDFGLTKGFMREFIDAFDHSFIYWQKDQKEYLDFVRQFSQRHIGLPVSPSAEMLSLFFLKALSLILANTVMKNNEAEVSISSVRLHETKSGYAEAFAADLKNPNFPAIDLSLVNFSEVICKDFRDPQQWQKLLRGEKLINPDVIQQVF